ncbi:MAG TPA: VacB/RNase II family 3'-5' exoribonuclease [Spirochaetota bacterium]|nr:VacB/RNase II family 3'-5' exoribonuclease [Spirochaetota bacterium]HOH38093.1 VacB/RNase II family 3'-5' exoribonuclease [Spirochaetota bacterium]HPY01695.1 VacB/RNase II family 3'-5' exoribonuclease [Spirochaetota bacterium]HQA53171.1 VacB/RNase II family 3'-5' exoribonuclease [Spirochaetota bacterium]
MPLSPKKIIEVIQKNQDQSFSANKIISLHNKSRKGKKDSSISSKDIQIISDTLEQLKDTGYLIKKNAYQINPDFTFNAEITAKEKHQLKANLNGVEITIRNEESKGAENGDSVIIEFADIRKNSIYCRVRKISRKKETLKYGIADKIRNGIVFSKITFGEEPLISASKTSLKIKDDEILLLRLKNSILAGYAESDIVERVDENDESHDIPRIISMHSLPSQYSGFDSEHEITKNIPKSEYKSRKDFRKLFTVTIDGETAKDFDDAISFEDKLRENVLYVHIADVSAHVAKDSPLDAEAMKRGTSYYLGNKVIPMLPEIISNKLCSLREGEDKLTLTAILTYNKKNELKKYEFCRSTIRVDKRLTYKNASEIINSQSKDKTAKLLRTLDSFTKSLKEQRMKTGRIDMNLADSELVYHEGKFTDIVFSERLSAHSIVEESMLSANEAAAHLLKKNKVPALYRVHEKTSTEKLYAMKKFLASFNVNFRFEKGSLGVSIQNVLDKVKNLPNEHVINFVVLKSMMQAVYSEKPEGHFGLGFTDYTHFTSPIRRYPDLIVHRAIKSYIDRAESPYTDKKLYFIGDSSSKLERIAQKAERDLFRLKSARLMKNSIGREFDGIISGVSKFGIYILLNDKPVEGMVPFRNMSDDYYYFIEDEYAAKGKRTGRKYTIGDAVKVRVSSVNTVLMRIDFVLIKSKNRK